MLWQAATDLTSAMKGSTCLTAVKARLVDLSQFKVEVFSSSTSASNAHTTKGVIHLQCKVLRSSQYAQQ